MSLQGLCGPISILALMKTLHTHRASDMLLRDVCAYHDQVFIFAGLAHGLWSQVLVSQD